MEEFAVRSAEGMREVARAALARISRIRRTSDVRTSDVRHAAVLALSGELGAGKTTFTQALGEALGATGPIQSPTYVIMKKHALPEGAPWRALVHIDAYRLNGAEDLGAIGWGELLADPSNLIAVEWPERVGEAIPEGAVWLRFGHDTPETRTVRIG